MRYLSLVFICLFFSQQGEIERKYWDSNNKLVMSDYNWVYLRPRKDVRASTVIGIENKHKLSRDSSKISFTIRTFAELSNETWVWMVTTTDTLRTMNHEQVHFNIEEISARNYRRKLQNEKVFSKYNLVIKINSMYKNELERAHVFHREFDSLTTNCLNRDSLNIKWLNNTEILLEELEEYSIIDFEVEVKKDSVK